MHQRTNSSKTKLPNRAKPNTKNKNATGPPMAFKLLKSEQIQPNHNQLQAATASAAATSGASSTEDRIR